MKALTVQQPWASLIAYVVKTIETRSWETKHRGLLAIHASKRPCDTEMLNELAQLNLLLLSYPLGKIVAIVELVDIHRITPNFTNKLAQVPFELVLGDFTPGRFAWQLKLKEKLKDPIPAQGHQGLWEWEAPEELL